MLGKHFSFFSNELWAGMRYLGNDYDYFAYSSKFFMLPVIKGSLSHVTKLQNVEAIQITNLQNLLQRMYQNVLFDSLMIA